MKMSLQNFNGFFQVEYHTRLVWLVWILSLPLSILFLSFGIWAIVVDFFHSTSSSVTQYNEKILIVLCILTMPVPALVVGITKALRKPGIYLRGVRILSTGIEIGTLILDVHSQSSRKMWENNKVVSIVKGNWKDKRKICQKNVNFLVALQLGFDSARTIFLERFVVTSKDKPLYQIIGNNSSGIRYKDFVVVSNGSFQLLVNNNGIPPDQLVQRLDLVTSIISNCKPFYSPSYTLKIRPDLARNISELAYGMIGGFNTVDYNFSDDLSFLNNVIDKDIIKSTNEFLKKNSWTLIK